MTIENYFDSNQEYINYTAKYELSQKRGNCNLKCIYSNDCPTNYNVYECAKQN